ncbi:MAG: Ig-like domain-containing protein [Pyrinomonadaceae bacterium]
MRLATRALIVALVTLVLCAAVSAQTLRSEKDPRNQSPSVGTGGPEGGPTGLFTIYDASTIRRGEFTFSIAYSNYDRDPGNVDITDVPLSFNVGLNDHIELFFKTNGWRGIKVNNPTNLSSFYLPNSQLFFSSSLLGSGPAIVMGPSGPNVGTLSLRPVFRPAFNQPFVQFPFTGGSAGTFGLTAGGPGSVFGFPGFNALLGPATIAPNSGNFGSADNFPGIGSPAGSILPGIVLATTVLPATALTLPITVPVSFTTAPSYLPDAPFVNRLYGTSSFTNFVVGGKIRLTGPNNAFGVAIIPFYRWWPDKADDLAGFNQMQRGAGPGGDIGDFGIVGVVDGRLSKHVNVSANAGYILNSNPKGAGGDFVLLDRPDEFIAGLGFDFPVNKHFQPIAEVRSTQYVGGRTPNAFENSPVDVLGGVKIYPRRWWGFGVAYRRQMNQQDENHFNPADFNIPIAQLTNLFVPNRGVVVVPGTSRASTVSGFPTNFRFSEDPNGFIGQFWIGRRNVRSVPPLPNVAPIVSSVVASLTSITRPCPPGTSSTSCTPSDSDVTLTANATDADNDTLLYTWSVTGGTLSGEGKMVTWNLSGVANGTYTAAVTVNDGNQHTATGSATVTVADCTGCVQPPPPCPNIAVSCPSDVDAGTPITFTASLTGGPEGLSPTYNWSVSAGTISSGQGTSTITVDTTGAGGQSVTASVSIGGIDPACTATASCTTSIKPPPREALRFDEYGNIRFNDEKARLDNYAIQLQNDPGSTATIIAYGSCAGEGQTRADRAKDYLVNTRGIEAGRITSIDGGCRSELTVQLWIVPQGSTAPAASTDNVISPCPECRRRAAPRRRRGRGDDE